MILRNRSPKIGSHILNIEKCSDFHACDSFDTVYIQRSLQTAARPLPSSDQNISRLDRHMIFNLKLRVHSLTSSSLLLIARVQKPWVG
jgi:hypothetical protein